MEGKIEVGRQAGARCLAGGGVGGGGSEGNLPHPSMFIILSLVL